MDIMIDEDVVLELENLNDVLTCISIGVKEKLKMVKREVMALEMLENLIGLSEKSFVQFVTYVEDIDETKKIKVFLNILVKIASEKRQFSQPTKHWNCL